MAAAVSSLLRRHHHRQSLLRAVRSKHSLPDHNQNEKIGNFLSHQIQQSKWFSRLPHSISRKCKELDFPSRNVIPTIFSSTRSSSSSSSSSSPRVGFVGWYLGMIKTQPVVTKSITAGLIYTAADLSSQTIVGEEYDVMRTVRMAGYGLLIVGPSLHFWFNFVSRVLPKRDLWSTFAKMALGQTVYGPTVTALFFSVNAAFQGESGSEIVARLKRDLVPTLIRGVMYWPICDFITFRFVPVHLQPLVSNSFSYLWTVYLTYMAGLEKVDHDVKVLTT